MGILDFFKFSPPGHKKIWTVPFTVILTHEKHILDCCTVDIGASGSLNL